MRSVANIFYLSPVKSGFFILSLCFVLCSCTSKKQSLGNQVVLKVNEESLTTKTLAEQMARKLKQFDAIAAKDPQNIARVKEECIRQFLIRGLTLTWAEKNNLVVSEEQINKEVEKVRASYPDDLAFRRVLAQENLSFNDWKSDLKYSLIERLVFKKITDSLPAVTNEEVKSYYEANRDNYRKKERIYLKQIVVDKELIAERIREELKTKKFDEVAKKFSMAPEAKDSGVVGWVEKGSVDVFDKAFSLPIGGLSQVLESPYGFHIFKVEKKAAAGILPLADVDKQIRQKLLSQKEQAEFSKWLDQQVRSAKVLRNNELINAINVETRSE